MEKDIEIVLGIVEYNGKFLVVKRAKKEGSLIWAFPGGKIEAGENETQALIREIKEETNIISEPVKKIGERIHPDTHIKSSYLVCKYKSGEIKPNLREVLESKWASPQDIIKLFSSDIFKPVCDYLLNADKFAKI